MLSRAAKQAYYVAAGPLMKVNGVFYRRFKAPKSGLLKVHLGPGQKKYMPGWVNVDANMFTAKCDMWGDLRNPLPFHSQSVDTMYSYHVIEHLPNMASHFSECFRCLKPGGVYRVGGPNGDSAIKKFTEDDRNWFGSWPDDRRSIGGRFENFIFCRGEHVTILTLGFLQELLTDAGFTNIRPCVPTRETHSPERFSDCLEKELESDFDTPHTLIVEAEKPVR